MEVCHFTPWINCVSGANSIESFLTQFPRRQKSLDLILLDIGLPGLSGIEGIPLLKKRFPSVEIVMLTQYEDPGLLLSALHAGAYGYLLKDFPLKNLPSLLKIWEQGGALLSPVMARALIAHYNQKDKVAYTLNEKELQLLDLFSKGYTYEETATTFGLSVDGVRYYVKKIYEKLHVTNKAEAVTIFIKMRNNENKISHHTDSADQNQ